MSRFTYAFASCAWLTAVWLVPAAAADEVQTRPMNVRWADGAPEVQLKVRDFADKVVRKKLSSGLPQVMLIRVYAYRRAGGRPVALGLRSCRVVYDLWEDLYRVQVESQRSERAMRVSSQAEVIDVCLDEPGMRLGQTMDFDTLHGKPIYFSVLVELNPMSPDTVQRIRRWLARPGGGRIDGSEAFFGSFVSIFVNRRIGDAERTLRFRSPTVMVP